MLSDYHVSTCSRQCASTGRSFAPGEIYFSLLTLTQGTAQRLDYCAEAWQEPTGDSSETAWWRSRVPTAGDAAPQLAPSDVLLNLFTELADRPAECELRYLLGLLLVRKRVLRLIESSHDAGGREIMSLDCPRRNESYDLLVAEPPQERAEQLESRIASLLYSDAE